MLYVFLAFGFGFFAWLTLKDKPFQGTLANTTYVLQYSYLPVSLFLSLAAQPLAKLVAVISLAVAFIGIIVLGLEVAVFFNTDLAVPFGIFSTCLFLRSCLFVRAHA